MNTSAAQLQNHRFGATILAWPHKEPNISLTEIEVREKVISILADELGLNPDQIQGDTHSIASRRSPIVVEYCVAHSMLMSLE